MNKKVLAFLFHFFIQAKSFRNRKDLKTCWEIALNDFLILIYTLDGTKTVFVVKNDILKIMLCNL